MASAHVTEAEWGAKGQDLFGPNQENWQFQCPACGHVMSIAIVNEKYAEHLPAFREHKFAIECECIGRAVPSLGCDWCAYGLFRGPLFVKRDSGNETPCFDFAGLPFTEETCHACHGHGYNPEEPSGMVVRCDACDGKGRESAAVKPGMVKGDGQG